MVGKALFLRILQSCNPNAYNDLTDEFAINSVKRFFSFFGILFIIMALLFIPGYFLQAGAVSERLGSFSSAEIAGTFSADGPVTLLASPEVVYNQNASSTKGAFITVTNEAVYYKKFLLFGSAQVPITAFQSLESLNPALVAIFALFLLPAIIFWSGAYILLKVLVLIILFAPLGWLCVSAFRQQVTLKRSFQCASYAVVPMLLLEMLLFPFWRNGWVMLALFLLFFALGLALLAQRKVKKATHK